LLEVLPVLEFELSDFILLRGSILELGRLDLLDRSAVLLLELLEVLDVLGVALVQCCGGLFELLARFGLKLG